MPHSTGAAVSALGVEQRWKRQETNKTTHQMPERSTKREGRQDRDRTVIEQRLKRQETRNNTPDAKNKCRKRREPGWRWKHETVGTANKRFRYLWLSRGGALNRRNSEQKQGDTGIGANSVVVIVSVSIRGSRQEGRSQGGFAGRNGGRSRFGGNNGFGDRHEFGAGAVAGWSQALH
jgi:hypothetical protein